MSTINDGRGAASRAGDGNLQQTDLEKQLRACVDDPMWATHAETSKALLQRAADAVAVLQMMEHAFGKFANTPKANRCYPTREERARYERVAMSQARAALGSRS